MIAVPPCRRAGLPLDRRRGYGTGRFVVRFRSKARRRALYCPCGDLPDSVPRVSGVLGYSGGSGPNGCVVKPSVAPNAAPSAAPAITAGTVTIP